MIRRYILIAVALLVLALAAPAGSAWAQPSAPPAKAQAAPAPPVAAPNSFYAWVAARQAEYNKRLASVIREIRTGDPWVATALLAALSFAYGILHAAGPGHGKAIISSYVLANERTVRRRWHAAVQKLAKQLGDLPMAE